MGTDDGGQCMVFFFFIAHVYDEVQTPSGIPVGQEKHVIINKVRNCHMSCHTHSMCIHARTYTCPFSNSLSLQKPYESFGMSIAGGKGPMCGDMPVYINDLIGDGIVSQTKQIQVSTYIVHCVLIVEMLYPQMLYTHV